MIRKTMKCLLVAMVAAFALVSTAEAAPKKAAIKARAKHSSHVTAGSQSKATVKKSTTKKKAAGTKTTTKKTTKRTPSTKPR